MKNINAVIIVNWNQPKATCECVHSVLQKNARYKVFLVDNGSSDDSIHQFRRLNLPISVISLKKNIGFAGACNHAAHVIIKKNKRVENFIFLNNDTIVKKNSLNILIDELMADSKIGITTPMIMHYPEKDRIWAAGTELDEKFFKPKRSFAGQKVSSVLFQPKNIPWATGCCLCIRSKLFFSLGGFWDDLFMSAEDLDLSLKVIQSGFLIKFVHYSFVYHKEAVSSGGNDNPLYVYYQTRNDLAVRNKWNKKNKICILSSFLFYNFMRCIRFCFTKNFLAILCCLEGIIHAHRGQLGKYNSS